MPKLTLIASFYWLCLAQKVVSGDLYHKLGYEVLLKPDESTVTVPITSILWKHGKNKVADWDKGFGGLDIYGAFKDRTTLNQTTGELRISGLMKTDSGVYSVEFNGKLLDITYKLSVIKEVPKPTITSSYNTNKTSCTLTCEGDTTDAEPVTYSWKVGDGAWEVIGKQLVVSKSDTGKSTNGYKYICMLKNSVSSEVSEPVGDLFDPEPSEVSGVGVGVVVGVILVLVAIVVAGIWWVRKIKKGYPKDTWIYFLRMFCSRFCEHPNDNMREIFSKLFCGMSAKASGGNNQTTAKGSDGVQPEQEVTVPLTVKTGEDHADKAGKGQENGGIWWVRKIQKGYPKDTWIYFLRMFCSRFCAKASDGNNQTTAKGSDGVQPEQEVTVPLTVKTGEDHADKAEKGQENGGSHDKTKTDGSVGPGGNDETKMH